MHTLILALPPTHVSQPLASQAWTLAAWTVPVAADGAVVHSARASVAQLQAFAAAAVSIIVTVPMSRLAWHALRLPAGLRLDPQKPDARLRGVLQNQLEDQLASEAAHAHITLGSDAALAQREARPALAVVCDQAWLNGWLAQLAQIGIEPARITPHIAPEWLREGGAICSGDAQGAWVSFMSMAAEVKNAAEPSPKAPQTPPKPQTPSSQKVDLGRGSARGFDADADEASLPLPLTLPLSQDAPLVLGALLPAGVALAALPAAWDWASHALGVRDMALVNERDWAASLQASAWDLTPMGTRSAWARVRRRVQAAWQNFAYQPHYAVLRRGAWALAVVACLGANAWWWALSQDVAARRAMAAQWTRQALGEGVAVIDAPLQLARAGALAHLAAGAAHPAQAGVMLEAAARALREVSLDMPTPLAIDFEATTSAAATLSVTLHSDAQTAATLRERLPALLPDYVVALEAAAQPDAHTLRISRLEKSPHLKATP